MEYGCWKSYNGIDYNRCVDSANRGAKRGVACFF